MIQKRLIPFALIILLAGGCGSTPQDRAVSGAGVGAASGAVIGAIAGGGILTAAAIGATAGALTGVLTSEDQVNLGQPAWKQGSTAPASATSTAGTSSTQSTAASQHTVYEIQSGLNSLGYSAGPNDGIYGPKTRGAIERYQQDYGLSVNGQPSAELAQHIRSNVDAAVASSY